MAFNLQKVLRALLFASRGPLTTKDIQETLAGFHQQEADLHPHGTGSGTESAAAPAREGATPGQAEEAGAIPPAVAGPEPAGGEVAPVDGGGRSLPVDPGAEVLVPPSPAETDPELYQDVPSLITAAQIRDAMDAIGAELRVRDEVFYLIEGQAGYRLVTNPKFARWIRLLRDEPPPVRLSQAALETLAVVAYRQPVTRGEIETIRGVAAEAGLNKLLERGLIYVAGRAELPGRPIQYGTTDEFLEFVGVKSLAEMPASDVLSNRQIDDWLQQSTHPPHLEDRDVGLDTAELPLDPAEEPVASTPVPPADTPLPETPAPAPARDDSPPAGT